MIPPRLNFTGIKPKVPLFRGDGTGRDTYITHNSGGFVKSSCSDALVRPGSHNRCSSASKVKRVGIEGKTVIYHSNGTGRDSYVVVNSGGLTESNDRAYRSDGFLGGLRNYKRLKTPNVYGERDYFDWAQTARMGRDAEDEANKAKLIQSLTERLSKPKVKYNNMRSLQINNAEGYQSLKPRFLYIEGRKPVRPGTATRSEFQQEFARNYASENYPKKTGSQIHRVLRHQKSKSDAVSMIITGNRCLLERDGKHSKGL